MSCLIHNSLQTVLVYCCKEKILSNSADYSLIYTEKKSSECYINPYCTMFYRNVKFYGIKQYCTKESRSKIMKGTKGWNVIWFAFLCAKVWPILPTMIDLIKSEIVGNTQTVGGQVVLYRGRSQLHIKLQKLNNSSA